MRCEACGDANASAAKRYERDGDGWKGWKDMPWCTRCDEAAKPGVGTSAERLVLARLRSAHLRATWDGTTTLHCKMCRQDVPDVLVLWMWNPNVEEVQRRKCCWECQFRKERPKFGHKTRTVKSYTPPNPRPYHALITTAIEAKVGVGERRWSRGLREIHTMLCRHMLGLPHSYTPGKSELRCPDTERREAWWKQQAERALRWLGEHGANITSTQARVA